MIIKRQNKEMMRNCVGGTFSCEITHFQFYIWVESKFNIRCSTFVYNCQLFVYTSESLFGDTDHSMVGIATVSRLLRKESLSKLYISSQ